MLVKTEPLPSAAGKAGLLKSSYVLRVTVWC